MPEMKLKNGAAVRITEYQVSEIDADGEIVDANCFETLAKATKYADMLMSRECLACVIERRVEYHPGHMFDEPTQHKTLRVFGDSTALAAGNWTA
jgi:hypothetical protein